MTTRRIALLAGGAGLIGSHLLELLLKDPHYSEVVALVRRPWEKKHSRLRTEIVDFDDLGDAVLGASDVFCCLGTTIRAAGSQEAFRRVDYDYVVDLARRASAAGGVRFFVVSSIGADPATTNFYLRVKGEMEQAVREINFEAVHIFQPSLLLGDRKEFRFGERIAASTLPFLNPLLFGNLQRYRAIDARDVAGAMLGIARREGRGVNVHQYESIKRASDL